MHVEFGCAAFAHRLKTQEEFANMERRKRGKSGVRRLAAATVVGAMALVSLSATTAHAFGPPVSHGQCRVGDGNAGTGADGCAGSAGGCISTHAGVVAPNRSPFNDFPC